MLPDAGRLRQEEQHWLAELLAAVLWSHTLRKDELAACHRSASEFAAKTESGIDRSNTGCFVPAWFVLRYLPVAPLLHTLLYAALNRDGSMSAKRTISGAPCPAGCLLAPL